MIYVMVNLKQLLKLTVAAIVLTMGVFLPSVDGGKLHAQASAEVDPQENTVEFSNSQDVSDMLQALASAEPGQAEQLARQIRHIWDASGSASADYLLRRIRRAFETEDMGAALEHATALVDHAPGFAQGWAERARVYYMLDLYGPALEDLEQVLALNPQHFDAIMGLAVMLDEMGKSADAYEAYLQVKAIHPHQAGLTEALQRLEPQARGQEL